MFKGQSVSLAIGSVSGALNTLSSTSLLYFGSRYVISGDLSVGQLMAFNVLVGGVMAPIMRVLSLWDRVQEITIAVERLTDVLDTDLEQPAEGNYRTMPPLRGHIKLENMSFTYGRGEKNVLSNISLEIFPGQMIALVGRSGSGKTTLAKLMMGMYRPTEGKIIVDGVDLEGADLRSYRGQLGVVMQDAVLFSGTIAENIAMQDEHPDMERVIAAARLAAAHDFVTALSRGYETVLGERGSSLSGGQRQRISIARALYGNPRLIVMDEATSALDTESEKAIQGNMSTILADRTSVVIAHRLSTVQDADLIVVLDQGVILEQGTHRSLMDQKGLYFYLNTQQLAL